MGLADELRKLQVLRDAGTLSDEEFAQAKASLLKNPPAERPPPARASQPRDPLGDVVKAWVIFQMVTAIIGLIIAVIFFAYYWSAWDKWGW